ncbi:MAG: hypothetical protein GX806_05450 [Lentisphaerae bacterium]|nr:hypothetical protein [Lentisphaerota bacterium]
MKNIRLERRLNRSERTVIIAIDHGEFDGPLPGMINLPRVAAKIDASVDGILLSPAMLPHCRQAFNYKGAPLAVVRLNWSTVYCFQWNYKEAVTVPAFSPAEALRLGADAVLISLTLQTGSEANDAHNIEVFRALCEQAKQLGLPVIGEYFPADPDSLSEDEMHAKVYACARIISELGADCIKTFFTNKFKAVVASCPVPVLGLGAAKCPTQLEALQLAAAQVAAGAGGVVFGRNAIQVPNPAAFQRALCDVVKRGAAPAAAAKKHGLRG